MTPRGCRAVRTLYAHRHTTTNMLVRGHQTELVDPTNMYKTMQRDHSTDHKHERYVRRTQLAMGGWVVTSTAHSQQTRDISCPFRRHPRQTFDVYKHQERSMGIYRGHEQGVWIIVRRQPSSCVAMRHGSTVPGVTIRHNYEEYHSSSP